MKEISLCMIVKDEEDVIGRCLDTVKDIVDEIIIVDTGSTDKTKEIVSKYTDKIYDFQWVNNFAKARNFSFSKATKDYILWLDADDIIDSRNREKFLKLKEKIDGTVDMYQMQYYYHLDKDEKPTLIQIRERLVKREKNYQWMSPIHEVIIPSGNIEKVDIAITHKKKVVKDINRNLKIFEEMIARGIKLDDRQEYCYAKELYFLKKIPEAIKQYEIFIKKYVVQYQEKEYLLYPAIIELSDCYRILENEEQELETLMIILKHQKPKAECLCRIGDIFLRREEYEIAVYWFLQALNSKDEEVNMDYERFIPYISLGVCYFWLRDFKKAYEFNKKAGEIKPNDATYLSNKEIYHKNLHNSVEKD